MARRHAVITANTERRHRTPAVAAERPRPIGISSLVSAFGARQPADRRRHRAHRPRSRTSPSSHRRAPSPPCRQTREPRPGWHGRTRRSACQPRPPRQRRATQSNPPHRCKRPSPSPPAQSCATISPPPAGIRPRTPPGESSSRGVTSSSERTVSSVTLPPMTPDLPKKRAAASILDLGAQCYREVSSVCTTACSSALVDEVA